METGKLKFRNFTYICNHCRVYHPTVYCNKENCQGVITVRQDGTLICRQCGAVNFILSCPNCGVEESVIVK